MYFSVESDEGHVESLLGQDDYMWESVLYSA